MPIDTLQRITIVIMLSLLTVSAFFIRLENFKNSHLRSIDEIVYFRMAQQILADGPSGYNTIPYGKEMASAGRPLPQYFFEPLFKHPPVFTFLAALSMKLFGPSLVAAEYVSLAAGVIMIPLIYLLGALVFDRRVGILSAIFLWMDPISIICSQKVWMDTTIAFFTLLSSLLFAAGIKRKQDYFFILSGLAGGLAVNTKYTGILIVFAIIFYAFLYRKDLFKSTGFLWGLTIPCLTLFPWFFWNLTTYDFSSLLKHKELNIIIERLASNLPVLALGAIIILGLLYVLNRTNKNSSMITQPIDQDHRSHLIQNISFLIPVIFFVMVIPKQFLHSLQFDYMPTHSWQQGLFISETPSFYFGRLLEFSLLYAFSLSAILSFNPHENHETSFIRLSAVIILLFFMFWGSFQSRYILSAIPFLIILGTELGIRLHKKASENRHVFVSMVGRIALKSAFIFIVLRGHYLNTVLSFPNDMCYF